MQQLAEHAAAAATRGDGSHAASLTTAMGHQAGMLAQLVTDLLILARSEGGVADAQPVQLVRCAIEAVDQLNMCENAAGIAPSRVVLHWMPTITGDAGLLRQVFVNLIGNALKFSKLRPDARVDVGCIMEAEELTIYVRDNGVGFDPARATELFVPFRRLHGAAFKGNGIGLSIVRRVVENHGGRVWAETRPGAGSTFFFTVGMSARLRAGCGSMSVPAPALAAA